MRSSQRRDTRGGLSASIKGFPGGAPTPEWIRSGARGNVFSGFCSVTASPGRFVMGSFTITSRPGEMYNRLSVNSHHAAGYPTATFSTRDCRG